MPTFKTRRIALIRPAVAAALLCRLFVAGCSLAKEGVWIEGENFTASTFNQNSWYQNDGVHKDLLSPGIPGDVNGDWHAHYISSSGGPSTVVASYDFTVAEGGKYDFWIRLNPYMDAYSYSIDAGSYQHLDVTDCANSFNLIEPNIDTRFMGWIYVGEFGLDAGPHTTAIRLSADARCRGGIDVMAFVNFDWAPAGAIPPDTNPPLAGPNDWFALMVGPDEFSKDSIIDVCDLLDKPAGCHGPLQRNGSDFQFEDGTPVKFWGVGGVMAQTEQNQRQRARFWAKHGINMVRQHTVEDVLGSLQGPPDERFFDPAKIDKFDKWLAILKENGVYTTFSLFYHFVVMQDHKVSKGGNIPDELYNELPDSDDGKDVYGIMCLVEEYQDAEWEYANLLLNHVNPYTGLAYKDEPALAIIECRNEDSIFFHNPLNDLKNDVRPNHSARLRDLWQDWVLAMYGSDANLAAAWAAGMRPGDSVYNENMYVYAAYHLNAAGPSNPAEMKRMGDYIRFIAEMQRNTYQTYHQRLRGIGYRGVIVSTAWQAGGPAADAANLWTDDAMDAIDRHNYFGGGEVNYKIVPGQVSNATHLTQPGTGILDRAFWQVEDKPFIMTEYTQKPPNQWKAELSPLWAFYGMGLHGWDASYKFTASRSYIGNGWPGMSTYALATPHYIGQFPALAFAIYNNHLSQGDIAAARRLSLDEIFRGFDPLTQDYPGGGYDPCVPVGNLITPTEVFAIGRITAKFADGLDRSARQNWNLYWDDINKIIRSSTGQLTWDYGRKVVTVHSEKTQAIIGFAGGGSYDLPGVTAAIDTNFVSLIFTPLDNRPLIDSEDVLITAMAQDKQLGALYNSDGTQLLHAGGEPLLLEPVRAKITFKGRSLKSAKAVDVYGVPTERDVERIGRTIHIDGRYATYYYEVKRFSQADCDAANLDGQGIVNSLDYGILAQQWLDGPGAPSADIAPNGGDGIVDIWDLNVFVNCWLR